MGPALIGLLLAVGFYIGIPYFFYGILRTRLASAYKTRVDVDPWPIFRSGWISSSVWAVVWIASSMVMATTSLIVLLLIAILVLGVGGCLWLLVDFIRRFLGGQSPKPYWQRNPPPRLQFTMADLYVGILVYGLTMAIFAAPAKYSRLDQQEVVLLALLFLLGEGIAFYAALDVLRRTAHLKRPGYRALFLGLLMAYSSMLWPLTWMVFRAWRFTLWKQGEEREAWERVGGRQALKPALPPDLPPLPPYPGDPAQPG